MSNHDSTHDHGGSSSDAVDYGKVIGVGVGSLAIFALSIWWASIIYHHERDAVEAKKGKPKAVDVTMKEVGIVDQVPFQSDTRLPRWQAERRAYLGSYGWVDRAKGVVHIPIEQAMDQVVAGGSPAGAPK
jgi:hypothetical protein